MVAISKIPWAGSACTVEEEWGITEKCYQFIMFICAFSFHVLNNEKTLCKNSSKGKKGQKEKGITSRI